MVADEPCAACSWTHERQESCRYKSHVKLFYELSDRGVWAIGSNLIVKDISDSPPSFEARNIRFIQKNTTIPVPEVIQDWTENGRYFLITKRIPGVTLKEAWPAMSETERVSIAKQIVDCLLQLRKLCSAKIQSLEEEPVYSAFLFRCGYGLPQGPFASDDQLWEGMAEALKRGPENARRLLQQRMPPAQPYTFTHGDLTAKNIIVQDGKLMGILDWETSGFFPVWWESVSTRIADDEDDRAWKTLLRKHMEDYTDYSKAQEFWLDYSALSRYPDLDARGLALIQDSECGDV